MESSFCKLMPKLELHAHLNGSLSQKTLEELFEHHKKNGFEGIEDLDTSFLMKDSYSLSEFFQLFNVIYILTATPMAVEIATKRVIEDFYNDNVVYLELRSTLRKEKNMTKRDYIWSVIQGIISCRNEFSNISVKMLVSINRSESLDSAVENINLAIEYNQLYPDVVVGIDISGDPEKSKFSDYLKLLDAAREKGLKITVHCGEIKGSAEVSQVLEFMPDRIGHGTCIHESFGGSVTNWNDLLKKKIPIELCLTSNVKCKTVESYDQHHFGFLYKANHPISLATDDKGIFNSTLSEEFEIVQRIFGLNEMELWNLNYNSIDYIFGDENEKEKLRTSLIQWKGSEGAVCPEFLPPLDVELLKKNDPRNFRNRRRIQTM